MKRLISSSLFRNKKMSLMFILALCIILVIMPLLYGTIITTNAQVKADVEKHSRGSYDILVRPLDSRNQVEKKYHLVEENYLGVGQGGISIDDYKKIKEIDGVEIAAPIASLGYFTGYSRSIALPNQTQSQAITVQYYTSDGLHSYSLGNESTGYAVKEKGNDFFEKFADFSIINAFMASRYFTAVPVPQTYHLLVGIDPDSEKNLTGISFDKLKDKGELSDPAFSNVPVFPVMKSTDLEVPLSIKITVKNLTINDSDINKLRKKYGVSDNQSLSKVVTQGEKTYENLLKDLNDFTSSNKKTYMLDLSKVLNPFISKPIVINQNYQIEQNKDTGYLQDKGNTSVYYKTNDVHYKMENTNKDIMLSVDKVGNIDGIPIYREMKKTGVSRSESDKVPFVLEPTGSFSTKVKQNKLAASPLGIYGLNPIQLLKDGTNIHSTILPGSFVSSPTSGVTTLKAAEAIKGKKPIDAIRIRVGGITDYNKTAKQKIEEIAKRIASQGFDVDVVAGASYQKMKVDVQGIGSVSEPWTTLGAAINIQSSWSAMALLLICSFIIVGVIYLFTRLSFWRVDRQSEVLLLTQLGWDERYIQRKLKLELCILVIFSFVLSFIISMITKSYLLGSLPQTMLIQFIIFLMILLFLLLFKFKKKSVSVPKKIKDGRLVKKNLFYYKRYIRLPFTQLLITSFITFFTFLSIFSTINDTNLTILGHYVNVHASNYHRLVVISVDLLSILTMIESQMTLLKVRSNETKNLISIGWSQVEIIKLYFSEISIWSGIAILIGSLVAVIVYIIALPVYISLIIYSILMIVIYYLLILFTSYLVVKLRF